MISVIILQLLFRIVTQFLLPSFCQLKIISKYFKVWTITKYIYNLFDTCVFICVCVGVCGYLWAWHLWVCEGQRTTTDIFGCQPPFVWDKVFHWPGSLPCWLGWLGQPVSAFLIASAGTTGTYLHACLFMWFLEIWIQVLMLTRLALHLLSHPPSSMVLLLKIHSTDHHGLP